MRFVILVVSLLSAGSVVAGSASRNDERWKSAVDAVAAQRQARVDQAAQVQQAITTEAPKCGDDVCRVAIAGFASLVGMAGQMAMGQDTIPAPSYERDWAAKLGSLSPLVGTLAGAATTWHAADVNRDVSIAQFEFLGGAISSATSGMQAVATGATAAATEVATAGPRIDVAGDYTIGNGNATRGGQNGDNTAVSAGRDLTGRDHQDGSIVGDRNRNSSPGPIDQSDPGDDTCSGGQCTTPPVPDDDGGG